MPQKYAYLLGFEGKIFEVTKKPRNCGAFCLVHLQCEGLVEIGGCQVKEIQTSVTAR